MPILPADPSRPKPNKECDDLGCTDVILGHAGITIQNSNGMQARVCDEDAAARVLERMKDGTYVPARQLYRPGQPSPAPAS